MSWVSRAQGQMLSLFLWPGVIDSSPTADPYLAGDRSFNQNEIHQCTAHIFDGSPQPSPDFYLSFPPFSSFQKISPPWISLKRDSLPSAEGLHFPLSLSAWALRTWKVKYCWSGLERGLLDANIWHKTPFPRSARTSGEKGQTCKKQNLHCLGGEKLLWNWCLRWSYPGLTAHPGCDRSPVASSTLPLHLPEQISSLRERTGVHPTFVLFCCRHVSTVLTWAQASLATSPLRSDKGRWFLSRYKQQRGPGLLWALLSLPPIHVCCVTSFAGGFLRKKAKSQKKGTRQFPPGWSGLLSTKERARLHSRCLSYPSHIVTGLGKSGWNPKRCSPAQPSPAVTRDRKLLSCFQDNLNPFSMVFYSWVWLNPPTAGKTVH